MYILLCLNLFSFMYITTSIKEEYEPLYAWYGQPDVPKEIFLERKRCFSCEGGVHDPYFPEDSVPDIPDSGPDIEDVQEEQVSLAPSIFESTPSHSLSSILLRLPKNTDEHPHRGTRTRIRTNHQVGRANKDPLGEQYNGDSKFKEVDFWLTTTVEPTKASVVLQHAWDRVKPSDHVGHGLVFLTLILDVITGKPFFHNQPVLRAFTKVVIDAEEYKNFNLPPFLDENLSKGLLIINTWDGETVQKMASTANYWLKNKNLGFTNELHALQRKIDEVYKSEEDALALFHAADRFARYRADEEEDGMSKAKGVAYSLFEAIVNPFIKIQDQHQGKSLLNRFQSILNTELSTALPYEEFTQPIDLGNGRRMNKKKPNFKTILKHIISKHPKAYEKYSNRYKHLLRKGRKRHKRNRHKKRKKKEENNESNDSDESDSSKSSSETHDTRNKKKKQNVQPLFPITDPSVNYPELDYSKDKKTFHNNIPVKVSVASNQSHKTLIEVTPLSLKITKAAVEYEKPIRSIDESITDRTTTNLASLLASSKFAKSHLIGRQKQDTSDQEPINDSNLSHRKKKTRKRPRKKPRKKHSNKYKYKQFYEIPMKPNNSKTKLSDYGIETSKEPVKNDGKAYDNPVKPIARILEPNRGKTKLSNHGIETYIEPEGNHEKTHKNPMKPIAHTPEPNRGTSKLDHGIETYIETVENDEEYDYDIPIKPIARMPEPMRDTSKLSDHEIETYLEQFKNEENKYEIPIKPIARLPGPNHGTSKLSDHGIETYIPFENDEKTYDIPMKPIAHMPGSNRGTSKLSDHGIETYIPFENDEKTHDIPMKPIAHMPGSNRGTSKLSDHGIETYIKHKPESTFKNPKLSEHDIESHKHHNKGDKHFNKISTPESNSKTIKSTRGFEPYQENDKIDKKVDIIQMQKSNSKKSNDTKSKLLRHKTEPHKENEKETKEPRHLYTEIFKMHSKINNKHDLFLIEFGKTTPNITTASTSTSLNDNIRILSHPTGNVNIVRENEMSINKQVIKAIEDNSTSIDEEYHSVKKLNDTQKQIKDQKRMFRTLSNEASDQE